MSKNNDLTQGQGSQDIFRLKNGSLQEVFGSTVRKIENEGLGEKDNKSP